MTTKNPTAVGKALETIAKGNSDAEELFFDPSSGTLEVAKKGEVIRDRDRVPATQMAREGFFAPQAIVLGHELESVQRAGRACGVGVGHLVDDDDGTPEVVRLSILPEPSHASRQEAIRIDWHLNHREDEPCPVTRERDGSLWVDTAASPARARFVLHRSQPIECDAEIVQTGARAFTRNAAVLETDALAGTSVLCIGLGSGGSAVVDLLARSGVGRFLLWDMDRIEAHNVGRHVCTLRDLGRRKVLAVRDHIHAINPAAAVEYVHGDVLECTARLDHAVSTVDCVIVGTDNNASRFAVNDAAWRHRKTALYGRAFTRAAGGDVIQVRPPDTPCYACHVSGRVIDEEVSSARDATRAAYADRAVPVEPGLCVDIQPVANMIARLCLLRLSETTDSSLGRFAREMTAPLYLWANRREAQFTDWKPMERSYDRLAVLRWYAIGVPRDGECLTCGDRG